MTNQRIPAYQQPVEQVIAELQIDPARGLSSSEVQARLGRYGRNELPSAPPVPAWRRFLAQFQGPLTLLLLAATAISFVAWLIERESAIPYETITILAIVILNAVLGFVQENRAEQAVAALQAMAASHARVLRDGAPRQVLTAEVVPGDLLLIEEGDTLPADARVVEAIALNVAEAALTGESTSVHKQTAPIEGEAGIGDQLNMVFSGTAVTSGRGRVVVVATGPTTEIGKIAGSLQQTEEETTPLQKELDRVGRLLGIVVIVIAVIVSGTIALVSRIGSLGEAVDVLLIAVSLAVAAVPEGLTAITTIVLSLGMQRMARRNVIVRKLAAVETLGSTTVICTDKTGTLTKNEMTVRTVLVADGRVDLTGTGYTPVGQATLNGGPVQDGALSDEVEKTLRAAHMANNAALTMEDGRWAVQGDPTEGALHVAYAKLRLPNEIEEVAEQELQARLAPIDTRFPRIGEVPFSSERKLMSTAHNDTEDGSVRVFSKGAPDVLLARCSHERVGDNVVPLSDERRKAILASIEQLADEALRTIGVAYRTLNNGAKPDTIDEHLEEDLVFLGIVGMIDPPRSEAQEAVAQARQAGVRVVMITGDHPNTASAIAHELGISDNSQHAVTGMQLQATDDAKLRQLVKQQNVYARVAPEHKLRIVQALKAEGAIAAMTGDGVNDAPALKAADIGVAMGITGTDVSKGAADMILTDDNFASIVAAVEEGRAIFANIQKFLRYLLSSNIGEVLVMFFGVVGAGLLGLVPEAGGIVAAPLLSVQILWINLLTDSGPALALGIDPADPDVMQKPPRDPRRPVIDGPMWFDIFFVGTIMAIGTLAVVDASLPGGFLAGSGDTRYAQTMAFTTLVFFQLFNVFNARSSTRSAFQGLFTNPWLWAAIALSTLLQVAVIYLPFLQEAFGTVALSPGDWLLAIAVASSVLWLRELLKLVMRGR